MDNTVDKTKGQCPHMMQEEHQKAQGDLPLPPGKKGMPLLGETLEFLKDPDAFKAKRHRALGPIFRTHLFGKNTVVFSDNLAAKWVFAGENKYINQTLPPAAFKLWGGDVTSTIYGQPHRARRKLLMPLFERKRVVYALEDMKKIVADNLALWAQNDELNVVEQVRKIAFEVALCIIIRDHTLDTDFISEQFAIFTKGLMSPIAVDLPFTTFGKAAKAKARVRAAFTRELDRRESQGIAFNDIMGNLLTAKDENGKHLEKDTIINELILYVFAGHETTVTVLTNLLLELSKRPAIQEKCYQEAVQVVEITPENIGELAYTEQVIKEGMRFTPPLGGLFRKANEDLSYGGYHIPKGWAIYLNVTGLSTSEHLYAAQSEFDPDRFGPDRAEDRKNACAFLPFGGGPRTCIGMHFAMQEMVILLSQMMKRYEVRLIPGQNLSYNHIPFPLPKYGLKLQLHQRTQPKLVETV